MPAMAGAAPDADTAPEVGKPGQIQALGTGRCPLIWGPAAFCAAATVAFGVYPSPLIDWAEEAAASLTTFI